MAVEVEEKTIDVMRCIKECHKQNEKEDSDVDCHDQCDPRRKSVVPSSGNNHDSAARCREDCHEKCNDLDCIFKCNERCFHNGKEGSEDTSDDGSEDTPSSTSDKDDGDTNSSHSSNNVDEFDGAGRLSCPGFSSSDKKECKLKKRCTLTNCVESYSMIEGWSGSTTPQGTFGRCGRVDIVVRNNGKFPLDVLLLLISILHPSITHLYIDCPIVIRALRM